MRKFYFILCLLSTPVFAGVEAGDGEITELHSNAEGTFLRIKFSQPIKNPGACEGEGFYMLEIGDGSLGKGFFISSLLSAYTNQSNVSFWISGCTTQQYWGKTRPKIHSLYMR